MPLNAATEAGVSLLRPWRIGLIRQRYQEAKHSTRAICVQFAPRVCKPQWS